MALWWRDSKIPMIIWCYDKTVSDDFYAFAGYFYCDIDKNIVELGHRTTPVFILHEKGVLLQNIASAERIVCTYWLNIVGTAAPTAPMVPTPMGVSTFEGALGLKNGAL